MSKLLVTGPSKIHGTGVFAGADLPADLWIPIPFTFVDKDVHDSFDGLFPHKPFCYLNHAQRPKAEVISDEENEWVNALYLRLFRRIKAGTEITIHYGDEYWNQ